VWGSVVGERFWHALHGFEVPDIETERRSIGHSHVLAAEFRAPDKAYLIARRLAVKAASRLRRLEYTGARLLLGVRFEGQGRWKGEMRTMRTQDTLTLLAAVDRLWRRLQAETEPERRIKKVSITLLDLLALEETPADLFAGLGAAPGESPERRRRLCLAVDALNRRYGRDTVWFGENPDIRAPYTGTKIAFTRIPDPAEFLE
jgi:DNA polymerase-4